ncbi:MAG: bifunctional phosphopantothenoylcysteine decarboxylase/phosphopantothenate--cysteine ligase CoaBC [Thermonemataceae bacterium]
MLTHKKIIVAVSGSIAAYKAALLVRLLVKQEAEVKVVMSEAAATFITPLTLATLSKNPVLIDFVKDKTGEWHNHVALGLWADAMVVAPASAKTLAQCSYGLCNNLLTAVYLSAKCPVFFAPAMDLDMYRHPSTQENLQRLQDFGNHIIPSTHGELASGLVGEGRMAEPEDIVVQLNEFFNVPKPLQGKKALVTAGPTYEVLDPVRFIGNHSTGKMGFAIAQRLVDKGATVHLVVGPTQVAPPENTHIQVHRVMSAAEMYEQSKHFFTDCDIAVLAAAVADYKPEVKSDKKIKKKTEKFILEKVKTVDIAASLGQIKRNDQFMVGFALETHDILENARKKLAAKNFDFIILNSLQDEGAGFGHETNKVTILDGTEDPKHYDLKSKQAVAEDIVNEIIKRIK